MTFLQGLFEDGIHSHNRITARTSLVAFQETVVYPIRLSTLEDAQFPISILHEMYSSNMKLIHILTVLCSTNKFLRLAAEFLFEIREYIRRVTRAENRIEELEGHIDALKEDLRAACRRNDELERHIADSRRLKEPVQTDPSPALPEATLPPVDVTEDATHIVEQVVPLATPPPNPNSHHDPSDGLSDLPPSGIDAPEIIVGSGGSLPADLLDSGDETKVRTGMIFPPRPLSGSPEAHAVKTAPTSDHPALTSNGLTSDDQGIDVEVTVENADANAPISVPSATDDPRDKPRGTVEYADGNFSAFDSKNPGGPSERAAMAKAITIMGIPSPVRLEVAPKSAAQVVVSTQGKKPATVTTGNRKPKG
jgi:hypothetical protein